jgi:Fe2+ or Zn2+ uptake regulation protein
MSRESYNNAAPEVRHHFIKCEECGEMVDRRDLDEVAFHFLSEHEPRPDIPHERGVMRPPVEN